MTHPVPADDVTLIEEDAAAEYLANLGMDLDVIISALRDGEVESRPAKNDSSFPPTSPGFFRWAYTVATLRREHVKNGEWELHNDRNRPLLKSTVAARTLTACGGTADVGKLEGQPNVANKKGKATEEAYEQLPLMSVSQLVKIRLEDDLVSADGNWLLLYHRSKNELRAEVSLPEKLEGGLVTAWRVRVILPSPLFDDGLEELPSRDGEDDVDFYLAEA